MLKTPKGSPQRASSVHFVGFWGTVEENTWHFGIIVLFLES